MQHPSLMLFLELLDSAITRVLHLDEGELIESGDPDLIFTAPREKLTEDYVTGRFG